MTRPLDLPADPEALPLDAGECAACGSDSRLRHGLCPSCDALSEAVAQAGRDHREREARELLLETLRRVRALGTAPALLPSPPPDAPNPPRSWADDPEDPTCDSD